MELELIINLVLGILSAIFGGALVFFKSKLKKLIKLGKILLEAAEVLEDALLDNNITERELEAIKLKYEEAKAAFKALFQK